MSKILIVEDEYIERMELNKQMACEFGAENILTASNCAQAMDLIKKEIPDIVMLDIMLNGNSGFEVANFIKQNYPKTQIVIITAYNEFDFAYTAMNMGITDYLLKPVRPEIIKEKIKKMMCSHTKASDQSIIAWPYLEEGMTESLRKLLPFCPDAIGVTSIPRGMNSENEVQLMDLLEQKTKSSGWMEKRGNLIIIYLRLGVSHNTRHFFNNLYDACFRIGAGHIKFGVGECTSFDRLAEVYSKAIYAYRSTIFFQSYNVIYTDICEKTKNQPGSYPFDIEKSLIININNGDHTSCTRSIRAFVDYCLDNCGTDYQVLKSWIDNLKYAIVRYCAQQGIDQKPMSAVINLDSPENLYDNLSKTVWAIAEEVRSKTTIRNPITVKVMDIIKTRYGENLNLNMIAKELYINPIYLSRLFKEQTGNNFKEYLTKVRFETARAMLLDETRSVSEIAQHCGFNNPNYFSKAFKDCCGETPTEFRRQLIEKKI